MKTKVHFSSATCEWPTPAGVMADLDDEFHFNFDPCPIGGTQDGLSSLFTPWSGKRVFCNPPYGKNLIKGLERGLESDLAVFLIPARTDTRWFHEIVLPNAKEIRFIKGRLKFGTAKNSAPFPSMLVIFGNKRTMYLRIANEVKYISEWDTIFRFRLALKPKQFESRFYRYGLKATMEWLGKQKEQPPLFSEQELLQACEVPNPNARYTLGVDVAGSGESQSAVVVRDNETGKIAGITEGEIGDFTETEAS